MNTGFNVLQKTLTALNAENRYLGAPASLDFQPVAGEIEDHATNAAHCVRKAASIAENCLIVVAIETLVAAQAISLRPDMSWAPARSPRSIGCARACRSWSATR